MYYPSTEGKIYFRFESSQEHETFGWSGKEVKFCDERICHKEEWTGVTKSCVIVINVGNYCSSSILRARELESCEKWQFDTKWQRVAISTKGQAIVVKSNLAPNLCQTWDVCCTRGLLSAGLCNSPIFLRYYQVKSCPNSSLSSEKRVKLCQTRDWTTFNRLQKWGGLT
jgi:hypothetical protein